MVVTCDREAWQPPRDASGDHGSATTATNRIASRRTHRFKRQVERGEADQHEHRRADEAAHQREEILIEPGFLGIHVGLTVYMQSMQWLAWVSERVFFVSESKAWDLPSCPEIFSDIEAGYP